MAAENSDGEKVVWDPEEPDIRKTQFQASLLDERQSALEKYQGIVVGHKSLAKLIRYELMTTFLAPLPGALGLALRKLFFKSIFRHVGNNVIFGRSLTIRHPHKIFLGDNVVIDDYAVLDAKGTDNAGIEIGDEVMIGRGTVISCKNGNIQIGNNCNIAMSCFIQSAKTVTIGENTLISAFCYVIGGGDHRTERTDIPIIAQGQIVQGVDIGENCLLGAGVLVQDGVTLGQDVVIGSGAVVRDSVNDFCVAAGVPAKVVGKRR